MNTFIPFVSLLGLAALLVSGCASEPGPAGSPGGGLPAALGARWTPPAFAIRPVDGEAAAVLAAARSAAEALGYTVQRVDVATGRISAARRQMAAFDGARQDTLDVTVTPSAPGVCQVATAVREVVESEGGAVSAGLVRERSAYDAFFARLAEVLRAAGAPAL